MHSTNHVAPSERASGAWVTPNPKLGSSPKLFFAAFRLIHHTQRAERGPQKPMDFLKSAVASAISKGPVFGYSFGDRVDIDDSIWTLYNGTKRVRPELSVYPEINKLTDICQEDGSKCSIFSFDVTANKSRLPLARNALRKLRTLRHPGVVRVLDTAEVNITHWQPPRKS